MASVTQRGKTWQYAVSNYVDGKSRPIRKGGFKTKSEALKAAKQLEAELLLKNSANSFPTPSTPSIVEDKQSKIIFAQYFYEWMILYKSNTSKVTQTHYLRTYQTILEHFKDTDIRDITKNAYQNFLNEYGSTRAKETIEKLHSQIRACVLDARDDDVIAKDFTRKAKLNYTVPAKPDDEKHLNYHEAEQLLNYVYKKLDKGLSYYLILLGLTSGLRYSELIGLTWFDFNFEKSTIRINKTWGYSKRQEYGFGPTKNEASKRVIKVDRLTMRYFEQLRYKAKSNLHSLVFYSDKSKYQVIANSTINKTLKKLTHELNIERITSHGLRHTHASILIYKEVSIYYIAKRLGHDSIDTTNQKYAHLIKEYKEKEERITMSLFENRLNKKEPNSQKLS